jgi:hypothetical protein
MINLPIPVSAPLRFLPRGVGGTINVVAGPSVSIWSVALVCEKLRRESWDCVSAVGVSGLSSSSEMGDGIRRLRSSSISCLPPFRDVGGCDEGALTPPLEVFRPPTEPLVWKPSPFIPLLLNVGCIGVGIRGLLLARSEPNKEALSIAGRINRLLVFGEPGERMVISWSMSML